MLAEYGNCSKYVLGNVIARPWKCRYQQLNAAIMILQCFCCIAVVLSIKMTGRKCKNRIAQNRLLKCPCWNLCFKMSLGICNISLDVLSVPNIGFVEVYTPIMPCSRRNFSLKWLPSLKVNAGVWMKPLTGLIVEKTMTKWTVSDSVQCMPEKFEWAHWLYVHMAAVSHLDYRASVSLRMWNWSQGRWKPTEQEWPNTD